MDNITTVTKVASLRPVKVRQEWGRNSQQSSLIGNCAREERSSNAVGDVSSETVQYQWVIISSRLLTVA